MARTLTTVKVTRKELNRLLKLAKDRKLPIRHDQKGEVDNIYIKGKLFAESVKGQFCNLIIWL